MFKRYTLTDVTSNQFYQMPKFLFEGELKNSLSNDAKVLYSLLKDRHELSVKNNWVNEKNEVYLIYTREDLCDMLGCSPPTLRKTIDQLKKNNLMDEQRQGFNKPNYIFLNYINNFDISRFILYTEIL
ncbi:MAG: replication initiator protein A [Oscillospiraceae bacterium]